MVGGLTQRIKVLEQKHSELESKNFLLNLFSSSLLCLSSINYSPLSYLIDLEKIKEEVVAKEAKITKLQEECQTKDRSIAFVMTRHKEVLETCEKKIEGN